jgi:hypothetical protein
MFCLTCEALCQERKVRPEEERLDLKKKKLDLQRKRSYLQEKGNIYKLCALIKVRIVKSLSSRSFVLCRSKISEIFCF